MMRFWGHVFTVSVTAGTIVAMSSACAHDDSTIFIRGFAAPPSSSQGGTCVYSADPGTNTLALGTLDVGLLSTYFGVAIVGNQLIARADRNQLSTETNRVALNGAVVRVTDAAGHQITSFTTLGSGFCDPSATGQTPGYGIIGVTLVDGASAEQLRGSIPVNGTKTIVANVMVFGKTLGGTDVETQEFSFPLNVCNGCLVQFPAESVDQALAAATGVTNCRGGSAAGGTTTTRPCVIGQDQPVDCRLCSALDICDPAKR